MKNRLGLFFFLFFFAFCWFATPILFYLLPSNADIAKNGTGGAGANWNANNDASNLFRLETVLSGSLNPALPANLPTPMLAGALDLGSNVVGVGGLVGFDYAVLHYGTVNGGNKG